MAQKRRGNGEGSIYQRSDGTWCATYSAGYNSHGKRVRRTIFGVTREEARDKLTKILSTKLSGPEFESSRLKLNLYLERWLEDSARPTVRITTYQSYRGIINNHINPQLGGVMLAKLTPTHILGLYADMERDGASPRVRQLTHAVLRRALKQVVKWGLALRNVCDAVDPPRVAHKEISPLTPEQVDKLLKETKHDRLHGLYVLAVTIGMRLGELFALQWPNVDLSKGTINVCQTLIDINGQLILAEPKTTKSRRLIQLPKVAVYALKKHRAAIVAEGLADVLWVFCNQSGNPLRRSHFHAYQFKPLLKHIKLPDIRFHDLRHTSATMLLSAGVHPKVVQERLGHAQISITLDTYSHVLPSMQREAAEKFDEMLKPKNTRAKKQTVSKKQPVKV